MKTKMEKEVRMVKDRNFNFVNVCNFRFYDYLVNFNTYKSLVDINNQVKLIYLSKPRKHSILYFFLKKEITDLPQNTLFDTT